MNGQDSRSTCPSQSRYGRLTKLVQVALLDSLSGTNLLPGGERAFASASTASGTVRLRRTTKGTHEIIDEPVGFWRAAPLEFLDPDRGVLVLDRLRLGPRQEI